MEVKKVRECNYNIWFLLCYKNDLEAYNFTDLKDQFYISCEIRHNGVNGRKLFELIILPSD